MAKRKPSPPGTPDERKEVQSVLRPTGPHDAARYVDEVMRCKLMHDADERSTDDADGSDTYAKFTDENGRWDPERKQLHQEIVGNLLEYDAAVKEPAEPHAIWLLGLPGSGKSSFLRKQAHSVLSGQRYTYVSADDVKEQLPEDDGANASYVHDESGELAREDLFFAAASARHNVMMEELGSDHKSLLRRMDGIGIRGWRLHAFATRLPAHIAVTRVVDRFLETGRYLPPEVALHVEQKVEKTLIELRNYAQLETIEIWDTSVPPSKRVFRRP